MSGKIEINSKVKTWLEACKLNVDQRSRDQIDRFISGAVPFTETWYYAMPIRPDIVFGETNLSIFRKSFEEELTMLGSQIV